MTTPFYHRDTESFKHGEEFIVKGREDVIAPAYPYWFRIGGGQVHTFKTWREREDALDAALNPKPTYSEITYKQAMTALDELVAFAIDMSAYNFKTASADIVCKKSYELYCRSGNVLTLMSQYAQLKAQEANQ